LLSTVITVKRISNIKFQIKAPMHSCRIHKQQSLIVMVYLITPNLSVHCFVWFIERFCQCLDEGVQPATSQLVFCNPLPRVSIIVL